MELKVDHIDNVEEFHGAVENYVREIAKALAMQYDKACLEAFKALSKRKKKKIRKWILKEIKKQRKEV